MEQGARKNVKQEQGEWTIIRREQGAETPPLGASYILARKTILAGTIMMIDFQNMKRNLQG